MAPTYPALQDALKYPARERTIGNWLYQAYGVPWVKDDANERLKNATAVEYEGLVAAYRRSGGIIR